jgi:Family of unknown function (DUF6230)
MKDTSGAQVLGRTSLKRLGIVMVPTVVAAGALTVLMASGAIAVGFDISGQTAQMTIGQLNGTGFAQYGDTDSTTSGATAVAVSAFKTAKITKGLCQSVSTNLGPLGTYTLTLSANSADATDLIVDLQSLQASEADFTKINIGVDASQIQGSAAGAEGHAGLFGQEANGAILTNIKQVANATSAGQFDLHGMGLSLSKSSTGCIS